MVSIQNNDRRIDDIHNELKKMISDLSTLADDSHSAGYQESTLQNGTSGTAASICWLEGVIQDVSLLGSLRSDRNHAAQGLVRMLDVEAQERVSVLNALKAAIRSLSFMGDELRRDGIAESCASLAEALVQGADGMISLQGDALLAIEDASTSVKRANFSDSLVRDFDTAAEQAKLGIGASVQVSECSRLPHCILWHLAALIIQSSNALPSNNAGSEGYRTVRPDVIHQSPTSADTLETASTGT